MTALRICRKSGCAWPSRERWRTAAAVGHGVVAQLGGMSALAIMVFLACGWRQTSLWHDNDTMANCVFTAFPDNPRAHELMARVLMDRGRTEEAMQHFRRMLELRPDSGWALQLMGRAVASQGRVDEAMAFYRRSLEVQPDSAEVHSSLANALAMQGRLGEALPHYQRGAGTGANDASAYVGMSKALIAPGQLNEALAHCQTALQIEPNLAVAHYSLGNVLAHQGQLDEALAEYRKTLEMQPRFSPAAVNAGDISAAGGKFHEVLVYYRKALESQPRDPRRSGVWHGCGPPVPTPRCETARKPSLWPSRPINSPAVSSRACWTRWLPPMLRPARFRKPWPPRKALELARQQNNRALADALQDRIAHYEAGKPYHQTPAVSASP